MASTPNYPQSNFPTTQDAPYGGAPANRFGTPARQFIDSCIQAVQNAFFKYLVQPATIQQVVCGSGCSVGDVCYFDEGQFMSAQAYYARNKNTGTATAVMWGVFLDAAGVGGAARICVGGVLSPAVVALGSTPSAGAPISVSASTGRLHVAVNGETVVGYADVNGNVWLLFPGRAV